MKRALFAAALTGCAAFRPMIAPSADLEDYRAYRVAAAEGTRLKRAKQYLERHPDGTFAAEVRAAFDDEEPKFFEKHQSTREGALRYLADLPDGPHADAAIALLTALESNMQDAELRDIVRKFRNDDARMETAAQQRRAVSETILGDVGVLLDEETYGVRHEDGPPALKEALGGRGGPTWGALPARREEDLFFLLPTRPERESRLLTLELEVFETDGVVTSGSLSGADMFVAWTEADQIVKLDSSALDDRIEAQVHAMEALGGALERRFPAGSCPDARAAAELYHRACDGWEVVVTAGSAAGEKDSIVVRRAAKKAPQP